MGQFCKFLVVADIEEERTLYLRTLLRKFPEASVVDCKVETALAKHLDDESFDGVVVHFNANPNVIAFVRSIKARHPARPIIALSGVNRSIDATAAGASFFLLADQWLMLGPLMHDLLAARKRRGASIDGPPLPT